MMISKTMNDALNAQINKEFASSFTYLAMAFEFEDMGLQILGSHFRTQSSEEQEHAMKLAQYILDVGGRVRLHPLPQPREDYGSAVAIVEASVAAEKDVTASIHKLVDIAIEEKDHATRSFLNWFVDEQVEEVSSMEWLLSAVKAAGEDHLFIVEQRVAAAARAAQQQGHG